MTLKSDAFPIHKWKMMGANPVPSQKSPRRVGDGLASPVPPVDDAYDDEAEPAEPAEPAEGDGNDEVENEVENDHGMEEDPNHKAWWDRMGQAETPGGWSSMVTSDFRNTHYQGVSSNSDGDSDAR